MLNSHWHEIFVISFSIVVLYYELGRIKTLAWAFIPLITETTNCTRNILILVILFMYKWGWVFYTSTLTFIFMLKVNIFLISNNPKLSYLKPNYFWWFGNSNPLRDLSFSKWYLLLKNEKKKCSPLTWMDRPVGWQNYVHKNDKYYKRLGSGWLLIDLALALANLFCQIYYRS